MDGSRDNRGKERQGYLRQRPKKVWVEVGTCSMRERNQDTSMERGRLRDVTVGCPGLRMSPETH